MLQHLFRQFRHDWAWLFCCIPALAGFSYGFCFALNGLVMVQDSFTNRFCVGVFGDRDACHQTTAATKLHDWVAFKTQWVATLVFGAMLGAMSSTLFSEKLGRRANLSAYSGLFTASTLWCIADPSLARVLFARLLMGLAIGGLSMIAPVYLSEISSPASRGRTGVLLPITLNVSLLVAALVTKLLAADTRHGWQLAYLVGVLPSAFIMVAVWCAPESPRWLFVTKGRESAERALRKLRTAQQAEDVSVEMDEITRKVAAAEQDGSWAALAGPELRPRVMTVCTLQFLAHLSGISALLNYAPTILQEAGFSDQFLGTLVCYAFNLCGCLLAVLHIDRSGRRRLMLLGAGGMLVSHVGASLADALSDGGSSVAGTYCIVLFLSSYFLCYASSFGAVLWVLMPELFPMGARTRAVSLASFVHFSATYLSAYTLEVMFFLGIDGALACFSAVCAALLAYVYFWVPETAGKSLEEVDMLFRLQARAGGKRQHLLLGGGGGEPDASSCLGRLREGWGEGGGGWCGGKAQRGLHEEHIPLVA